MSFLIDLAVAVLAYLGWRVWLCFLVALVTACLLVAYDVAVIRRYDIALFAVLIGIGTGVYWEVESEDLQQR